MLDAGATIKLAEFLDLALAKALSWLVDGHFDSLIEVSHDSRPHRAQVRMEQLVIDREKAMEV